MIENDAFYLVLVTMERRENVMKRILTFLVALLCFSNLAWGLGEEQTGNEPVRGEKSPPGVLSVINDTHRVYRWWVNGNEKFFFRGDTIALNSALEAFAAIESDKLEMVLRPGPVTTSNFHGDQEFPYNWNLHLIGGIVSGMSKEDLGVNVWPSHPILYVYVGNEIQLSDLEIPKNITVLELSDLKKRYSAALRSSSQSVRGWTCGELAALDKYNTATMTEIAKMLEDDVVWVRLNAAGALQSYGGKAKAVLPQLRAASETDDESLKKRISETIEIITASDPEADQEDQHSKVLKSIALYCADRQ